MRLAISLLVIIAIVATAALGIYHYGFKSEPQAVANFPEKLQVRVELRSSDEAIQYRFIKVSEDGERLIQIRTEFRDGVSIYDYFRADGTLREETEYYPDTSQELELSERQVKRSSQFNDAGTKIVAYQSFRDDGTADVFSRTRADESVESEKYALDGKLIVVRQIKDKYGRMILREHFRDNGSLETVIRRHNRETRIVSYQADGITMKSQTVRESRPAMGYGYYGYSEDVEHFEYHDDGVTVKMKIEYPSSSSIRVRYFNSQGVLVEKRYFNDYGRKEVNGYYSTGQKRYQQNWSGPGHLTDRSDFSGFDMTILIEYGKDGKITRRTEFWDNGNPKRSWLPDQDDSEAGLIREYREEDGTLEIEKRQIERFKYEDEKTFEADEGIKTDIPSALLTYETRGSVPEPHQLPDYDSDDDI